MFQLFQTINLPMRVYIRFYFFSFPAICFISLFGIFQSEAENRWPLAICHLEKIAPGDPFSQTFFRIAHSYWSHSYSYRSDTIRVCLAHKIRNTKYKTNRSQVARRRRSRFFPRCRCKNTGSLGRSSPLCRSRRSVDRFLFVF